MKEDEKRICVTGAGGFVASWVVNFLLSRGYLVHGTVRNPCDEKISHLKGLKNAEENLRLFKADLLDYDALRAAITGCSGVLHVACPVPSKKVELIEPALTGTRNVLNACLKENVKKVVVVSSIGAVVIDPSWPRDQPMDESCWTDLEFCKSIEEWYCAAKTMAETEAWEYAKRTGLKITMICPSIVIGPMLQQTVNASSLYLLNFLKGLEPADNGLRPFVDVRDLAEAILLLYEKQDAEGRYICSSHEIRTQDLVEMLKSMFPSYRYPNSYREASTEVRLCSEKLQRLGWKYRPFEEIIADSVHNYEEAGLIPRDRKIPD
ncbi:hypothetical protein CDL15_Pgr007184 [Punica granatum]|uniref:NAD-dependent epimerase/dehydratase domain-containing protein n=1 Tax=Punica granatum TaxID=22663 RepID=A0A218X894_PUNGR|nr:hypothetical protein CDL15_Pgr007184 [Punica granatum]PKI71688.1 hypothetical protein CRG98_007910 [Punica granatum]